MSNKTKGSLVQSSQRGFTLIELLIVIVIIVILTALLAVSYTTIQRNARDSQRKGDLAAVAGAMERFYGDNSSYPASDGSGKIYFSPVDCIKTAPFSAQNWGTDDIDCSGTSYLKQLPSDPVGGTEYCYISYNQQLILGPPNYTVHHSFSLYANMEGKGNISAFDPVGCSGTLEYNYVIKSSD